MAGGPEIRPPADIPAQRRELLTQARVRHEGRALIGTTIIRSGALRPVLEYYREHAADIPGNPNEAFDVDLAIARSYQEGVRVQTERGAEIHFLGDYIAQARGRIMEIDAELNGTK